MITHLHMGQWVCLVSLGHVQNVLMVTISKSTTYQEVFWA